MRSIGLLLGRGGVGRLPKTNRNILMLNHMHNLLLHCKEEQHQEIHEQDRPEHGHVEYFKESHKEGGDNGLGG